MGGGAEAAEMCRFFLLLLASGTLVTSTSRSKNILEDYRLRKMHMPVTTVNQFYRESSCKTVDIVATDPVELAALKQFYTSTGGSNWLNKDGWLTGDPCKDGWFGVCCNEYGKVTELNLPSNSLVGEFPSFMSSFKELTALRLARNYLMGGIPTDLFSIKTLEAIDLRYNKLEGPLPDIEMPVLKNLSLSNNMLGGLLSVTWNVPKLQILSLASNRFEGSLPNSLQNVVSLKELDLSANFFSGTLPSEYGNLVSLEKLWLFENDFKDVELPTNWMKMRSLHNIQMNGLSGQIPKSIGNDWVNLEVLILVSGQLTGSIPDSICELKKLQYLHVFYNNISGSIPDCICENKASSLISIDLSNNLLTGPIPECIGNLQKLLYLYLSNNGLTGSLPTSIGQLKELYSLDVNTNRLSGSIPASFSSLRNSLNQFDLSTNYLSSIDSELETFFNAISQRSCNLDQNPISCPIPSFVQNCGYLRCSTCNTGKNHTSCAVCVKTEYCGWCNEIPNCLSGFNNDGPSYPYTCKSSEWFFGKNSQCP